MFTILSFFFLLPSFFAQRCSLATLRYNLASSEVILPEDVTYVTVKNDAFAGTLGTDEEIEENLAPDIIIIPSQQRDIAKVLKFAQKCGFAVSVRSGGHNYAGLSSCSEDSNGGCIQVVMDNFVTFETYFNDDDTLNKVTLGAGWRLKEAQAALYPYNALVVAGLCHGVGAGGHFSSSASGWLSKLLGTGLNRIESFKIALAGGKVVIADRDNYADLYFGVLGGAPGSLGIVLEYTIEVVLNSDVPNSFGAFFVWEYSKDTYYDIWQTYLSICADPDFYDTRDAQLGLVVNPRVQADNSVTTEVALSFFWAGLDNGNIYSNNSYWYDKFIPQIRDASTVGQTFAYETNATLTDLNLIVTARSAIVEGGFKHYSTGHFSEEPVPSSYIDNITDITDDILTSGNLYIAVLSGPADGNWGTDVRDSGNGFPWPNWSQNIDTWVLWYDDQYAQDAQDKLDELENANIDFWNSQGQGEIGIRFYWAPYGDLDLDNMWSAYYPNRRFYEKVKQIKNIYDPKNVFRGRLRVPLPADKTCNIGVLINKLDLDMVIIPEDPEYEELKNDQWAGNLGTDEDIAENLAPDAIVFPETVSDIQTALLYARDCGYAVAVRSGGHSYEGLSSCPASEGACIQIDMSAFTNIELIYSDTDPTQLQYVTIGSGWRLGDVDAVLNANNVTVVRGLCENVGAGGHFSSSGYGYLSRSYGMGLDRIAQIEVVLSNGKVRTANPYKREDLYFGVIGGGTGSYGIVTQYTIEVIRDEDVPNAFGWRYLWLYSRDNFYDIMKLCIEIHASDDFVYNNDINIGCFVIPATLDGFNVVNAITVGGMWTGNDNGDINDSGYYDKLAAPFLNIGTPLQVIELYDTSLSDIHSFFVAPDPNTVELFTGTVTYKYQTIGDFAGEPLDVAYLDNIVDQIDEILTDDRFRMYYNLVPGGGKIAENLNTGNGWAWRNWVINNDIYTEWENDTYAEEAIEKLNAIRDSNADFWNSQGQGEGGMKSFWAPFGELDMESEWRQYFPNEAWYNNLRNIKKKYDPDNVFRGRLTIPLPEKQQRRRRRNRRNRYWYDESEENEEEEEEEEEEGRGRRSRGRSWA